MQKTITFIDLLNRLNHELDADFVHRLSFILLRVVAAVHCFFPPRDSAGEFLQV